VCATKPSSHPPPSSTAAVDRRYRHTDTVARRYLGNGSPPLSCVVVMVVVMVMVIEVCEGDDSGDGDCDDHHQGSLTQLRYSST
jgi:hypothetical protein